METRVKAYRVRMLRIVRWDTDHLLQLECADLKLRSASGWADFVTVSRVSQATKTLRDHGGSMTPFGFSETSVIHSEATHYPAVTSPAKPAL